MWEAPADLREEKSWRFMSPGCLEVTIMMMELGKAVRNWRVMGRDHVRNMTWESGRFAASTASRILVLMPSSLMSRTTLRL